MPDDREYNRYDPRIPFNDNLSHFMRMSKGDIESYFSAAGPLARVEGIPNWVERTGDGEYEMVRLDGNNEVEHRYGVFFTMKIKPIKAYEQGKGKAVATWDYRISVPSTDEMTALQFFSDDSLKYVFAYPGGLASAIPPRMRQMHQQFSTLRMRSKMGDVPLMPFVNLAFYQWLEDTAEQNDSLWKWLINEMPGWRDAYQA